MKKLLLTLVLLFAPASAWAQCTGIFPTNTFCGNTSGTTGTPYPISITGFTGNAAANTVFAGPVSGPATTPAFRALIGADLPFPSASTLGGIEAFVAVPHQWINAVSTLGVPTATQPACGDLSNSGTACQAATGTTGATVPLNNGGFTQSGTANFTSTFQVGGNTMTFPATAQTLPGIGAANTWSAVQTFNANDLLLAGVTGSTQCLQANSSGVVTGTGAVCGGGTINSGTSGQLAYYGATGTTVSGNPNSTISGGQLTLGQSNSVAGSIVLESGAAVGAVTITTGGSAGAFTATIPPNTGTIAELNLLQSWTATQAFAGATFSGNVSLTSITGSTQCLQVNTSGLISGSGGACAGTGAVSSVTNVDGTITVSPTTGAVVVSIGLSNANKWLATQSFASNVDVTSSALTVEYSNDTSTGTTIHQLAFLNTSAKAQNATTSTTSGILGIVVSGAGTSGVAQVANVGQAICVFDNSFTAAHYVQASASTAGNCHDVGATYPTSGQIIGRVLATGSPGSTLIEVFPPEIIGAGGTSTVTAVSNSDGTLTISPTTGAVVASLALGHANIWTAAQTFTNSDVKLLGSSTGATTFTSANAGASNFTLTFPAVTDTLAVLGTVQTFSAAQTFSSTAALSGGGSFAGTFSGTPTLSGANFISRANLAQVAAVSLSGNPTGSLANESAITLGSTLNFSGTTLNATTATTSQLGAVKPDGSTITIAAGVISAAGGSGTVTNVATGNGLTGGPITTTGTLSIDPSFFPNLISGLITSNDGTTPNSVLDIASGVATDSTNAALIKAGAFTKSTAGAWASGSGSNGMGNGLTIANNTYYSVCLANNAGTPDYWFDTSATCANRPSGISDTKFRQIMFFKTDGSAHILSFVQTGDQVVWGAAVAEPNIAGSSFTTPSLTTLSGVPSGVKVTAQMSAFANANSTATYCYFQSPDAASASGALGLGDVTGNATVSGLGSFTRLTNASAQLRISCGSGTGALLTAYTMGYVYTRGKQ